MNPFVSFVSKTPQELWMRRQIVLGIGLIIGATGLASAQRPVESRDLLRLREVSDPQLSPDGGWVAYTVSTADTTRDRVDKDIWMTSWMAPVRCG